MSRTEVSERAIVSTRDRIAFIFSLRVTIAIDDAVGILPTPILVGPYG
jgi:hypothetical protein